MTTIESLGSQSGHQSDQNRYIELSRRELDVLMLMAQEYTIKEIATTLYIGVETVKTHRKKMMYKLESKSAVGLVLQGLRLGYVEL